MGSVRLFVVLSLLAAAAGCGTLHAVREARDAQHEWAARGEAVARGQPDAPLDLRALELPQLVDFALTNRPSMAQAILAIEDARLALRETAADAPLLSTTPWGGVGASATFGHAESSRADNHLRGKTDGGASGALSLDVLVYDFGRNAAQTREKAEAVVAAELAAVTAGYQVFEEVVAAYYELLQNEALLDVARESVFEYSNHLEQTEARLEYGEAKEVDVLKARFDLARAVQEAVSASNDVETAGADLMAALGVDASQGDFRSVLGPRGTNDFLRVPRFFPETAEDSVGLYALACTNAPVMEVARARLRGASARVDAAVAELYPSIGASLSLNWTDPLWYWRWGVNAAQTLFSGWRRTAAVERATVALDSAAQEVDAVAHRLSYDIELAVAERDNAREALETAKASIARGRENAATVREQFHVGDVSRVDYSAAVADLASACGDGVRAVCRGQVAEAKLYRLTGRWPVYQEGDGK